MAETLTSAHRPESLPRRRQYSRVRVLAAVGAVLVAVQLWVWVAWLADGPRQVTEFQDPEDFTFKAARVMEFGMGVAFVAMLLWLTRRCAKKRKLVFDAKLFIAAIGTLWLDACVNFVAPIWLYNTNFTNTPPPTAYIPGVINPVMKDMPFPTLFHAFNYPVALVVAAIVVSSILGWLRRRFPTAPMSSLLALCVLIGLVFDFIYECFMFRAGMWAFPGTPDELALWSSEYKKYPIFELIPAAIAFGGLGALRYFRNDRGEHPSEHGLHTVSPRWRPVTSILATLATVNLAWIFLCAVQAAAGFYSDPYKPMPTALIANICDSPLIDGGQRTGTDYGQCPQQGGRIPIRGVDQAAPRVGNP